MRRFAPSVYVRRCRPRAPPREVLYLRVADILPVQWTTPGATGGYRPMRAVAGSGIRGESPRLSRCSPYSGGLPPGESTGRSVAHSGRIKSGQRDSVSASDLRICRIPGAANEPSSRAIRILFIFEHLVNPVPECVDEIQVTKCLYL